MRAIVDRSQPLFQVAYKGVAFVGAEDAEAAQREVLRILIVAGLVDQGADVEATEVFHP